MNFLVGRGTQGNGKITSQDILNAIKELDLKHKIKSLAIFKLYQQIEAITQAKEAAEKVIQRKYLKLDEPILQNIHELASGKRPLRPDEIRNPEKYLTPDEIAHIPEHLQAHLIPHYWKTCLKNSPSVAQATIEEDWQVLEALTNIRVVDEDNTDNFTTVFEFAENPYFANSALTKRFVVNDEGEPVRTEASPIQWKGKNLAVKEIKKKQKNKKTGQQRMVTRQVDSKSFFRIFRTLEHKEGEELTKKEEEDNEKVEEDFGLIGTIVDDIVPYSLEYFLGLEHEGDEDFNLGAEGDEEDSEGEEDKKAEAKNSHSKSKSRSKSKGKAKGKEKA